MQIQKQGQTFSLLPEKAIFWHEKQTLLLSDLHLGKATHFQKAGLAVPMTDLQDLAQLTALVQQWQPQRILLLGDLFHSKINTAWQDFVNWRRQLPAIQIVLVKGNHDILPVQRYAEADLEVIDQLEEAPFIFTHQPLTLPHPSLYNLCGHLHPAVLLVGKGKQKLTLPCFFFGSQVGYLPAFGSFTGFAKLKPNPTDEVYWVAENKVGCLTVFV